MADGDASSTPDTDELIFLLKRAGIVLPPEQMAEVEGEYAIFREQIALVNGAYTAQDEPSLIFVAQSRVERE